MRKISLFFACFLIITNTTSALLAQSEEITRMTTINDSINNLEEIPHILEGTSMPAIHLEALIDNKKRDVVLLGEVHIATKQESMAVAKIMPYFNCLAYEGVDVSTYAEGRFFSWISRLGVNHAVTATVEWDRSNKHKSPIDQVEKHSSSKKTLHLEEGWKPNIRTRILLILLPIMNFLLLLGAALFIAGFSWSMFSHSSIQAKNEHIFSSYNLATVIFTLLFVILIYNIPALNKAINSTMNRFTDFLTSASERNNYMTKTLIDTLNKETAIESVLVITGKAHTAPMAEILKKKYGFTEIPM